MSEFDKLRALLDIPAADLRPMEEVAAPGSEGLRSASQRRRRWLFVLMGIVALDAIYLFIRTLLG